MALRQGLLDQLRVTDELAEKVIEVVGYLSRQLADRFEALGPQQLLFQLLQVHLVGGRAAGKGLAGFFTNRGAVYLARTCLRHRIRPPLM
jgi:hypothetical protein